MIQRRALFHATNCEQILNLATLAWLLGSEGTYVIVQAILPKRFPSENVKLPPHSARGEDSAVDRDLYHTSTNETQRMTNAQQVSRQRSSG